MLKAELEVGVLCRWARLVQTELLVREKRALFSRKEPGGAGSAWRCGQKQLAELWGAGSQKPRVSARQYKLGKVEARPLSPLPQPGTLLSTMVPP